MLPELLFVSSSLIYAYILFQVVVAAAEDNDNNGYFISFALCFYFFPPKT